MVERRREQGKTLVELLVGMLLFTLLVMVFSGVMARVVRTIILSEQEIEVQSRVIQVEDALRKELQSLYFSPFCPSMLPAFSDMRVGLGVSSDYHRRLTQSVVISSAVESDRFAKMDLHRLRGRGSSTYPVAPLKILQGIVQGSDIVSISGLRPTGLRVEDDLVNGVLPAEIVGVRSAYFYITDCRSGMLLKADRYRDTFRFNAADIDQLSQQMDMDLMHLYVVSEYLIYLQVRDQVAYFVVDYLDGQAFLRVPHILDFKAELQFGGVLAFDLLAGIRSIEPRRGSFYRYGYHMGYEREFENDAFVDGYSLLISLE